MSEAAVVSIIALLGWLILVWRSGALRDINGNRKMGLAAVWLAIFATIALIFKGVN